MVLSECVYKRPVSEMVRFINKFKSDFGGQIVSLERVQPSLDHVPHQYLLAEAGDTLFASFIGTKQYKDVLADANILQGAIFHEDSAEDFDVVDATEPDQVDTQKKNEENQGQLQAKPGTRKRSKPAAHRGFLARAKGIPALELYRLALKKKRKLVLCGHSLGGAVAALATLAILRVLASSPMSKEHEKVQVKCITFSQPPVGNAALKDYVDRRGWQHYFKTYCIPEDLVPRILSPAYFHHYNAQTFQEPLDTRNSCPVIDKDEEMNRKSTTVKSKETGGEQLVLGLGPVQTSFWRLSKLVPLDSVRKHLNIFKRSEQELVATSSLANSGLTVDETESGPQSLEIQEGSDGISLTPLSDKGGSVEASGSPSDGKSAVGVGDSRGWRRVPYLPSYVPFGQLYLLGSASVELLSDAEYSKLTSVRSVIAELKERLQSHSMRSYRFRFQKIYDQCMCLSASTFLGVEQLPQFPQLQKWLGLADGTVELGHIVDPPIIRTATSIVPLGWSGLPGNKNAEPLKVDIIGQGLHRTLVQAQVNGKWCSTAVESLPAVPPHSSDYYSQQDLQKMRVLIGSPLKQPPKLPVLEESVLPTFFSEVTGYVDSILEDPVEEKRVCAEGLNSFVIHCTSDFITVSKKVYVRTRRVKLLGFEGAGKSSLFKAILNQGRYRNNAGLERMQPEEDAQEGVVGGVCYLDSAGVNLQEIHSEVSRFREELQSGVCDLTKKIDLVVLVHNLSQKIPQYHRSDNSLPTLSILLNEAKARSIPWIFAITNKFSVSAHQQKMLVKYAMEAYEASQNTTVIVNTCPFVVPTVASSLQSQSSADKNLSRKEPSQWMIQAPLNLARMTFQKRGVVFPVDGIAAFRQLVHHTLRSHEEVAFEELANERLALELAKEQERAVDIRQDSQEKGSSVTAAAVGASLGAGVGIVMAIVMGAASALRKP